MSFSPRHNALLFLSAVTYLGVLVLVTLVVDRQFYQPIKLDIVQDGYFATFPLRDRELLQFARDYLLMRQLGVVRPDLEMRVRALMRRNLAGPVPLVRIVLRVGGVDVLSEERADARQFNTWRNCLVLRDFRAYGKRRFDDPRDSQSSLGEVVLTFTSPLGFAPLDRLTARYRLILIAVLLGITQAYLLLLRFLVLPIRRVTGAIQGSHRGRVGFIERPRSRLEALYNVMARDALLSELGQSLDAAGTVHLRATRGEVMGFLSARVCAWFGFERVALFELRRAEGGSWELVREMPRNGESGEPLWPLVEGVAADAWAGNGREERLGGRPLFLCGVPSVGEDDVRLVLALVGGDASVRMGGAWFRGTAERVARQMGGLLERHAARSRELFRERSEANISLSRSLGHDLTNIIATAKLELMTLSQTLGDGAGGARDAVARLLGTTRALQQIVNLYRAYEYLKSPRYEPCDLNQLLRETVEIFGLAMSHAGRVEYDLSAERPQVVAEPRLLKLAFFNLLVNAQDALRRRPADAAVGRILLHTAWRDDMKKAILRVSDNGPGIRTAEGDLAGVEDIRRIFELGYSTKENGSGEGLGLSWVRAILTEFHQGQIGARNLPEGGAEFEIVLDAVSPGGAARASGTSEKRTEVDER